MAKKTQAANPSQKARRLRRTPLFPAASFEEALTIANAIQKHAAGQKVRRLTLFDQMGKSPDSGPSRQLIVNSNKYGLTKGSYTAEHLELTSDGKTATSSEVAPDDKLKVRFKLAIEKIVPFNALYDALKGNRLPATSSPGELGKGAWRSGSRCEGMRRDVHRQCQIFRASKADFWCREDYPNRTVRWTPKVGQNLADF